MTTKKKRLRYILPIILIAVLLLVLGLRNCSSKSPPAGEESPVVVTPEVPSVRDEAVPTESADRDETVPEIPVARDEAVIPAAPVDVVVVAPVVHAEAEPADQDETILPLAPFDVIVVIPVQEDPLVIDIQPETAEDQYAEAAHDTILLTENVTPVLIETDRVNSWLTDVRLWSLGASVGSSAHRPYFITTVHGTMAPLPYSFVEIGMDLGLISEASDVGYYSFYPYVNYAVFVPFNERDGWYVGLGGGYQIGNYSFPEGDVRESFFAFNVITGIVWKMITVAYTLRIDFKEVVNHKLSIGYVYRFK